MGCGMVQPTISAVRFLLAWTLLTGVQRCASPPCFLVAVTYVACGIKANGLEQSMVSDCY